MGKCACKSTPTEEGAVKECGCKSKKKKPTLLLHSTKVTASEIRRNLRTIDNIKMEEKDQLHAVVKIDELPNAAYILRLEKGSLTFRSGQYVALNIPGDIQSRHYSIYSGENSDTVDFLIKEVENGVVSVALHQLKVGDKVLVEGPWGHFRIKPADVSTKKFLFIATGTGISPFHSFIKSYPELNYTLVHGVRFGEERYEEQEYPAGKYICCTSRDKKGDFVGRVTDYIKQHPVSPDTICYLCGNNLMIDDVHALLRSQGVNNNNIFAEIFF
jgi:Flavodoxin reductases (ferredoxin-NADPH reductases) family 1